MMMNGVEQSLIAIKRSHKKIVFNTMMMVCNTFDRGLIRS